MLTIKELQEMPFKDLKTLHDNATLALITVRQRERADVRAKIEQAAKAAGFTLKDLLRGPSPRAPTATRTRTKLAGPKYVNPGNPEETWSGFGRRPLWLADKLKAGKSIERFLSN